MKYKLLRTVARYIAPGAMLLALLTATGCAELGFLPPAPPAPPPMAAPPPPPPSVSKPDDPLPGLDAVIVAHHQQCEKPGGKLAIADDVRQVRDLMQWLKRSCGISDATLAPQLASLKQLRQRHVWPQAYAAWLDEWRRQLLRMQALQQRAATAEAAQATMVKRLRAIERDLTTRP